MDQDETWHAGRPRSWPHCVRWGPSSTTPKRGRSPQFSVCLLWPNGWMDQDGTWYGGIGLGLGDFVFDGDPAPPPGKRAQPPTQFLAHVYCGQTARWMTTPLGAEVHLGPGHNVLDGDPASPREKGTAARPLFSAHVYCGHGRPSQLLLSSG